MNYGRRESRWTDPPMSWHLAVVDPAPKTFFKTCIIIISFIPLEDLMLPAKSTKMMSLIHIHRTNEPERHTSWLTLALSVGGSREICSGVIETTLMIMA